MLLGDLLLLMESAIFAGTSMIGDQSIRIPLRSDLYFISKPSVVKSSRTCLNGTLSCVEFMDVIMGDI